MPQPSKPSAPKPLSGQLTPAGIALRYAVFAALWIIASGYLLSVSVEDTVIQDRIEIAKGLLFVAVTSVLVFHLARRLGAQGNEQASAARGLSRHSLVVALIVFLIAAVVAGLLVRQSEQQRLLERRAHVADQAGDHAHAIQRNIERALSATYALAALVRQGNGAVPDFEATAQQMLPYYPGAASLQLAPGGIVQRVVPLDGNEKAIGHNLLQDPTRDREAFLARDTGKLTLAGPFELVQGGMGVVGRLPVYLDDGNGKPTFWGFTSVLIRFPEGLDTTFLSQLSKFGFGYELWRLHPDTGQKQAIAISHMALADPVDRSFELPNGRWTLSVAPVKGWGDPLGLSLKIALGLLFSLLLGYLAELLVELRRYKQNLETSVARRTQQLSISEQRIRNMSDAAGAYLWEIDANMVYTYVSGQSLHVKGFAPEQLLGHTPLEFMPEEDIQPVGEIVKRAIADKSTFRLQHRDITPTGEVWWEEVYGAVFCDADGKVIGLRGTGMSINARKQAEAKLLETAQLNETIFSSSLVGIITYLVETGQCIFANQAAAKAVNATVEQLLAQNFREIESWKRCGLFAAVEEMIASGTERRVEIDLTSTFGRHACLDVMLSTFSVNGKRHLLLMYEDITERKVAETRVHRLTNLYAALSECNQAIVRCNSEVELFPQICRDVVQYGGMKMAWIGLLDASNRQVRQAASFGSGLEYLEDVNISADANEPRGRGPVGTAIRENHPVWNQDFLNDPLTAPWHERATQFGWGAVAALPLRRKGEVIGSFNLYAGEVNAFDEDARRLLEEMATDISYALDGFERDASLRLSAEVFEQGREGIMVTDTSGRIVRVNRAFTQISGYSETEALGRGAKLLSSGRQDEAFYREMWDSINTTGHWQGEIWNRRKDGAIYPEWLAISRVLDAEGNVSHYVGIFNDITRHKADEERIQRLAHFDVLTGLPNRALLNDRSRHAISMAQRSRAQLAVLFVDLDHFKNINDTLGHRIGDELLVEVAKRLRSTVRDEDTVSRQGGDEFIVVLPGTDAGGAAHVAEKLLESVARLFVVEQHELVVTPSIGIAMYPGDGEDFDMLSKCADTAMYRAKQDGRNAFRFFTPEMQARSARNLQLENALRHALARDQMQLHYQPQVGLKDGRIVGVEALLRWTHPDLGAVSPAEFIPVAEDSGLILPIGEWVLRTAVRQMKAWLDSGLVPMIIAVNLSAVQFRHAHLPDLVSRILAEEGLAPQYLELELTEGVAMDDPLAAIAVMDDLHARGIRMSIDDFGTGYSSLSYLKRFQVYKLKIDQSFVRDITVDPEDKAIVGAIISLADSLGLQTIAEGVETEAQLAFLREQGCNEVQGFYFSRPVPAEEFEAFVRGRA